MKLLWNPEGSSVQAGWAYGSTLLIKKLGEALATAGVMLCADPAEDFDLAVHLCRPDYFKPIPGRKNILYTTCESTPLLTWFRTEAVQAAVNQAAALVVPSHFCEREFSRFYPHVPLHVCPEGVDEKLFAFHQRRPPGPGETFTYLFCGTLDGRKGYDICQRAFLAWMKGGRMPRNVQLIIKTTDAVTVDGKDFRGVRTFPPDPAPGLPVIVYDNRNLPVGELVHLYNSAHCYLLPSRGEGWGQTLCDAMATGAPCIWTHWSALKEFADETTGYPVTKFRMMASPDPAFGSYADANLDAVVQRMQQVHANYGRALELGKAASARMHQHYRWGQAAEKFLAVCERYV